MWIISDIWSDELGGQHIELTCSECGQIVGFLDAIGRTIKPCECEK